MIPTTKKLITELLIADDKPVFLIVDGERKHIDRVDEYDTEVQIIPNGDVVIDEGR